MLKPDSLFALSVHVNVTVVPDTVALKLDGAAGAIRRSQLMLVADLLFVVPQLFTSVHVLVCKPLLQEDQAVQLQDSVQVEAVVVVAVDVVGAGMFAEGDVGADGTPPPDPPVVGEAEVSVVVADVVA